MTWPLHTWPGLISWRVIHICNAGSVVAGTFYLKPTQATSIPHTVYSKRHDRCWWLTCESLWVHGFALGTYKVKNEASLYSYLNIFSSPRSDSTNHKVIIGMGKILRWTPVYQKLKAENLVMLK
jgi:hypothetical protein